MKIKEIIAQLNENVGDVANHEKAVKLRRALLIVGVIVAALGMAGIIYFFASFVMQGEAAFNAFPEGEFGPSQFLPIMGGFMGSGLVFALGATMFKWGFGIMITGKASEFIEEAMETNNIEE